MKNAMKKIMSLMLVALLLVSILPVGASAAILGGGSSTQETTSAPKTGSILGAPAQEEAPTPEEKEDADLGGNTTIVTGSQTLGNSKMRTVVQQPTGTDANSVSVEVHLYDAAKNTWSVPHTNTLVLESHESYVTPVGMLTKHYAETYATANLTGVEVFSGATKEKNINVDSHIYPNEYVGKTIRLVMEKVQPISVWIKYNDRPYEGPAYVNVPNKTSMNIGDLLDAAGKDDVFEGLAINYTSYDYLINNAQTNATYAEPGDHVYYNLKGAIANAGGTVGGVQGTTPPSGSVGGDDVSTEGVVDIYIYNMKTGNTIASGEDVQIDKNGATVKEAIEYLNVSTTNFNNALIDGSRTYNMNTRFYAGSTVYIYMDSSNTTGGGSTGGSTGGNMNEHLWYPVYLNVFMDNTVGANPAKQFLITDGIAADYVVSKTEVENLLANHYNAKNSKGIDVDGLYLAIGNWSADFVRGNRVTTVRDIDELRQQGTVYINVVLYNATLKTTTTYTADSSNPKTGDSIYTAVTVMGLSAAALATAVYFYNKKRVAI